MRLPGISEILPSLYLCGAGVAIPIFLDKLGITCVINAAPELGDTPLSMPDDAKPLYLQIPVLDKGDINIGAYFDEVADLIEEVRAMNGNCMVHCVAGVSRSASLCLAYLMKHMKMSLKDAYELVKSVRWVLEDCRNLLKNLCVCVRLSRTNFFQLFLRRPQIRPNTGFIRQLIAYEEKLYQKTSVSMVFKESLGQEIPDIYEAEYHAIEQFYQKHRHLKLRWTTQ